MRDGTVRHKNPEAGAEQDRSWRVLSDLQAQSTWPALAFENSRRRLFFRRPISCKWAVASDLSEVEGRLP